jgi:uncharacterized protein YndB with AHSA1/START domain
MATIHHELEISAPAARVYAALSSPEAIGTWWDEQTPRQTERGLVLEHHPGPQHGVVKLLVVERVPNRRVEWECVSSHPASSPASAWTGTHFIFELAERDGATMLDFSQTGYDEQSPFFAANEAAWGEVLANLKRVVEARR